MTVPMGIQFNALGKKDYVSDPRTLKLADFILPEISVPSSYDTDLYRKPFPDKTWGNNEYNDGVIAARAELQFRLERLTQRRTLPLENETVINFYKRLTGCRTAGDKKDSGLTVLDVMRQWRNEGWNIGLHNYKIHAYGELDPQDRAQLQAGCYLLAGVILGFSLPHAVVDAKDWWYGGETGVEWRPGSWGGQAVYGRGYSANGFVVRVWGQNCLVNWAFIDRYCDEAWAVIDNDDSWRIKQVIDLSKLKKALDSISAH